MSKGEFMSEDELMSNNQRARAFKGSAVGGWGAPCRNSTVSSGHLEIGHVILIVLRSNWSSEFQGWFVPISLRPVLEIVAAYVRAKSGHHVLTSSTWWGFEYKTAQFRILSIALDKELKSLILYND